MRGVFQATIADSLGNVVPACSVEVRSEETGELVQLYDSFEAGEMLGNPLEADEDGFVRFYAESDVYRVDATLGAFERTWRHVVFGFGPFADQLQSGTYTPDVSAVANCSSLSASLHRYQRVGDIVTVSGSVALTVTSGSAVLTTFTVALPISSDFSSAAQAHGSGSNNTSNGAPAFVTSDATSNRILVSFRSTSSGGQTVYYTAQYEIL